MRHAVLTSISSLLLVVALVFFILASISAPVTSTFKLAAWLSYTYGIFGYCDGLNCVSASYPILFGSVSTDANWLLGENIRNTLSKIFIVAPIAAGLIFVALVFTLLSLCVHASAIKTISIVASVVAFVASALVAIIVVLVFHPYVQWLGWLLVAAAGCCLVVLPLLLFSITARDTGDDDDSDSENVLEHKYGDLSKMDTPAAFSAPSFTDVKKNQYGYGVDMSSSNNNNENLGFSYRGANTNVYNTLAKSLLDTSPSEANDVTRPAAYTANSMSQNSGIGMGKPAAYSGLKIQDVASSPIASNRHLAPNFVPSEVTSSTVEQPSAPYPHKDRASSIYNLRNYGVFDHHPSVEGHQPFTDLPDTDELAETKSVALDLPLDSDGESDFTSVSQRPPNDKYTSPNLPNSPPPPPHNQQQQNYGQPYQAYPPAQGNVQYNQRAPQQFPIQQAQNIHPGQPPNMQQPVQYDRYQPQYQPMRQPVNRPTVSDNALNNNPDFAIGFGGRRKQAGRPGFAGPPRSGVAGVGFASRTGQRDGPYGNI